MAWTLYGVFIGKNWLMTTNRKYALSHAKRWKGEVRTKPYNGACRYYDYPTFYTTSTPFADFREEKQAK